MDEPFAALDALTRRMLQEDLLTLAGELRFTVLFVTHAIDEAILIGTHLHLLTPKPRKPPVLTCSATMVPPGAIFTARTSPTRVPSDENTSSPTSPCSVPSAGASDGLTAGAFAEG
jgi:ABC-type nitrate/sulfonate/bicarbonate transport system ATPase subunit